MEGRLASFPKVPKGGEAQANQAQSWRDLHHTFWGWFCGRLSLYSSQTRQPSTVPDSSTSSTVQGMSDSAPSDLDGVFLVFSGRGLGIAAHKRKIPLFGR